MVVALIRLCNKKMYVVKVKRMYAFLSPFVGGAWGHAPARSHQRGEPQATPLLAMPLRNGGPSRPLAEGGS